MICTESETEPRERKAGSLRPSVELRLQPEQTTPSFAPVNPGSARWPEANGRAPFENLATQLSCRTRIHEGCEKRAARGGAVWIMRTAKGGILEAAQGARNAQVKQYRRMRIAQTASKASRTSVTVISFIVPCFWMIIYPDSLRIRENFLAFCG